MCCGAVELGDGAVAVDLEIHVPELVMCHVEARQERFPAFEDHGRVQVGSVPSAEARVVQVEGRVHQLLRGVPFPLVHGRKEPIQRVRSSLAHDALPRCLATASAAAATTVGVS